LSLNRFQKDSSIFSESRRSGFGKKLIKVLEKGKSSSQRLTIAFGSRKSNQLDGKSIWARIKESEISKQL